MKIVSWNCAGKFREKHQRIKELKADMYIIQECEDPLRANHQAYSQFAENYFWIGQTKNKGLGIFARPGIKLKNNNWDPGGHKYFLSVNVNGQFNLLAVWVGKPYIREYFAYQDLHFKKYDDKLIIIGDLNSNKIWDKKHGKRNHSAVMKQLARKTLVSAYHHLTNENHGEETESTFFLYRHLDKPYHMDYAILQPKYLCDFHVLRAEDWLSYSDHLPIVLEIKNMG